MITPTLRLSLNFDADRLQSDLKGLLGEEYVPHFNKRYYEGDWSVVPLRSVGGLANNIYPDPTKKNAFADTSLLTRCPYIQEVLDGFKCPLLAVRFLRLKAGSIIKEHKDYNLGF